MTAPQFADACPECPPGDHPAVIPESVAEISGSLRATYRHAACGSEWVCWWDPESAGWPLSREEAA